MQKMEINIADGDPKARQDSGAKLGPNLVSVLSFPLKNPFPNLSHCPLSVPLSKTGFSTFLKWFEVCR